MNTRHPGRPPGKEALDRAIACADMADAIDHGHLAAAKALGEVHGIPLELVWGPEDDNLEPAGNEIGARPPIPAAQTPDV